MTSRLSDFQVQAVLSAYRRLLRIPKGGGKNGDSVLSDNVKTWLEARFKKVIFDKLKKEGGE